MSEPTEPKKAKTVNAILQEAVDEAAHQFTETLVPRADAQGGPWPSEYPLWHGWAIREAFVAGYNWKIKGAKL